MTATLRRIADSPRFQNFVTLVIVLAGILVGVETYPDLVRRHDSTLHLLDQVVLWIFVAEAAIKIGAEGIRPLRYFRDPWNVFDFMIVVACFLPFEGQAVLVLRLLRLLRVLRLVHVLPKLQVIVGALLKSIPSMFYVTLLLVLLFYIYAVAGVFLFAKNDPIHFADLPMAMLTLFSTVTLEGWVDLMYINMFGCESYAAYEDLAVAGCTASEAQPGLAVAYFVSFVLLGTMIMLNLFVGVIMNGMEEAQSERERQAHAALGDRAPSLAEELEMVQRALAKVQDRVRHTQHVHAGE